MEKLGALPGEGRTKVAAQWDAICHFSPPPPAKQLFAIEISKSSPTAAGEIASIDAYAHTDPKKLHDLYSRWRQSHNNTGALLPPEGTTQGVNEVIVADIFVDFLRNSNQDPTQKASAIERFNSTWILDKPIEMNAVHLVPVRDSRPSPLFPGPRKK